MYVSVRTVETHREHVMKKLDIHNAAGLTKYAMENGLIAAK
jgi:DNA-binding NarL/FixJ family response regulator